MIFLAHGPLGPLDEVLLYVGANFVFFMTMGLAWFRARKMRLDDPLQDKDGSIGSAVDEEPH